MDRYSDGKSVGAYIQDLAVKIETDVAKTWVGDYMDVQKPEIGP